MVSVVVNWLWQFANTILSSYFNLQMAVYGCQLYCVMYLLLMSCYQTCTIRLFWYECIHLYNGIILMQQLMYITYSHVRHISPIYVIQYEIDADTLSPDIIGASHHRLDIGFYISPFINFHIILFDYKIDFKWIYLSCAMSSGLVSLSNI